MMMEGMTSGMMLGMGVFWLLVIVVLLIARAFSFNAALASFRLKTVSSRIRAKAR